MATNDPAFEREAVDIIGLYLNPPQHAAIFCVDEKTATQALDRRDRALPLSPGRVERHGFEYKHNGTLSLYAALNTNSGKVQGKTYARHTSRHFVDFLEGVVASCEPQSEIYIICDNLSSHNTKLVATAHPPDFQQSPVDIAVPAVSTRPTRSPQKPVAGDAQETGSRHATRPCGAKKGPGVLIGAVI
jgi:hypothetical protein